MKRLYRIEEGKMIAGVCGGLGDYFNLDCSLIRLLYLLFTVVSAGFGGIIVYIIAAAIIPSKSEIDRY